MKYVILECKQTLDFVSWGSFDYGVWSPTEMVKSIRLTKNGPVVKERRVAVMPGYAFVPRKNYHELRRHAPGTYGLKVLAYNAVNQPQTCTLYELHQMEHALLSEPDPKESPDYAVEGDRVICKLGPFAGFQGVAAKGSTVNIIRILINNRYVKMPRQYAERLP